MRISQFFFSPIYLGVAVAAVNLAYISYVANVFQCDFYILYNEMQCGVLGEHIELSAIKMYSSVFGLLVPH